MRGLRASLCMLAVTALAFPINSFAGDGSKTVKVRILSVRDDGSSRIIYAENLDMHDPVTGSPYIYRFTSCTSPSGVYRCPLDQGVTYKARVTKTANLSAFLLNGHEISTWLGQTWVCDPDRNAEFKSMGAHWVVEANGQPHCEAGRGHTQVQFTGDSGGGNRPVPAGSPTMLLFVVNWSGLDALKAGYHVTSSPVSGCPGWYDKRGDPHGLGHWGFDTAELVSGTLPPGLAMSPDGVIQGTPAEPGSWTASVQLHGLYCTFDDQHGRQPINIKNVNTYPLTFNVQGDAPRRVR